MSPIPVLCGRCRAGGIAGAGDFAHLGDLLDFTPVPRQLKRGDGWTAALQREFVAKLAESGSPRRAAEAMQKSLFGIGKLYQAKGADSFRAAWDKAVAIGEAAAAAAAAQYSPPALPGAKRSGFDAMPEAELGQEDSDEFRLELLERLVAKFMAKVALEREARLAGRVVEADFTVRQITCLEIAFDLMGEGRGHDGWETLTSVRRGNRGILELAETPISRVLDAARRRLWAESGEPARPGHPPERYLEDFGGHRTEPLHCLGPASAPPPGIGADEWRHMDMAEQQRRLDAQYAAEANAQIAWEKQARIDAAEWAVQIEKPSPLEGPKRAAVPGATRALKGRVRGPKPKAAAAGGAKAKRGRKKK